MTKAYHITKTELLAILAIAMVRLGLYGFSYFPVIDDWIQYMVYPLFPDQWNEVFLRIGLYATRPLAGLFDVFLWSKMPLSLAFFIITLLHAVSCMLFLSVSRKINIPLGVGFVIAYLLLPINTEATIWLSASTRLVVPLFFTALSLFFMAYKKNTILFWLVQLVSLFFYEQVALLSFVLCIFVAYQSKRKTELWIPVINFALCGIYYKIFSGMGPFGDRSELSFPNVEKIRELIGAIWDGGIVQHAKLYSNGISRGVAVLLEQGWYLPFIILTLVLIFMMTKARGKEDKRGIKLVGGSILILLPFLPFLFLPYGLSFRNFFPSMIGLGLVFDAVLSYFPFKRLLATGICLVLLVISFSELTDYKAVSIADKAYVSAVMEKAKAPDFIAERKLSLVPLNVLYAQHITNVTDTSWALTGCMRALTKNPYFPMIKVE